jgi:hypothetical protein
MLNLMIIKEIIEIIIKQELKVHKVHPEQQVHKALTALMDKTDKMELMEPTEQGLPGETGAIGPQGPNQINSTSIYTVSGPGNSTSAIFPTATDIAKCLPGDTVLSDSFNATMFGPPSVIVDFALPTQDGWQTSITRESNANILFNTLAQCFNNPFFYLFLITDTCYNY